MNCKISANLDSPRECGGQCDGERHHVQIGMLEELEWREQERLAIAELVDQAHHLILEIINGAHDTDVLPVVSSQLAEASQLLNWPRPFDPAGCRGNSRAVRS